jgi:hypothetical protein
MPAAPSKRGLGTILKWSIRRGRLRTPMKGNIKALLTIVKIKMVRIQELRD